MQPSSSLGSRSIMWLAKVSACRLKVSLFRPVLLHHQGSKLTFWGSGPPDHQPWESGGPASNLVVRKIISYIFTWNALPNMYSEAQLFNTHSFGTDSLPSEYWITEDDSVWWWCEVMRFRRHGLRSRMAYTLRLLFPSNHGKVLSHFLYGLLQSYSVLHSCLPSSPIFFFFPLASRRLW